MASLANRPSPSRCRRHGAVYDSSYQAGPDVGRLLERDPAYDPLAAVEEPVGARNPV
jgi:hypothetical protein